MSHLSTGADTKKNLVKKMSERRRARNVDTVKSLDDFLSEKYQDDMTLDMIREWREDEVAFSLRHPGEAALLHNIRWLFTPAKGETE